jgi:hypothetical protein
MKPHEFRKAARDHFGYLMSDYGFKEETAPLTTSPFDFLSQYVSDKTRVIVEGPVWDLDLGVYLTDVDPTKVKYGSYPLSDLLELRKVSVQVPRHENDIYSDEVLFGQMRAYAQALREHASDILMGDHTVFPVLASRTAERLK